MSAVNQSTDNAVASCQIMSAVNQSTDNAVASSQKHVVHTKLGIYVFIIKKQEINVIKREETNMN